MPTTVTKSIGTTGRDYSTLQTFEDAIPANLVTADQVWVGECYNDSEFSGPLVIASHTSDATRYIQLTAAAGQSFQDNAGVRTNPLIYDQSKGVGIAWTAGAYLDQIAITSTDYVRIERLQIKRVGDVYTVPLIAFSSASNNLVKNNIIGLSSGISSAVHIIVDGTGANTFINNLIYDKTTSGATYGLFLVGSFVVLNCTIVNGRGSAQGRGIDLSYGSGTINNTAVFGWTTNVNGTTVSSGDYNATDGASFPGGGTHNQTSKTYANQFESTTADWRLKSGSDCIGTGNTNASLAPNDISNFARGATTTGDISAWEFSSGSAATLSAVNGITLSGISHVQGIAKASLTSYNGLTFS